MTIREIGWSTLLALVSALVLVIMYASTSLFEITINGWPIALVGTLSLGFAVIRQRRWFLLLLLPIVSCPLVFGAMILWECSRGNCL